MSPPQSLLPRRVLLADPAPVGRDFTTLALHNCGIPQVDAVANGTEAAQFLATASQPVDCIIADVVMEQGSGLQLLQAIRCGGISRVRADICFMLLADSWTPQILLAAKALDVHGVILRPAGSDLLAKQILAARKRSFRLDVARYRAVQLS